MDGGIGKRRLLYMLYCFLEKNVGNFKYFRKNVQVVEIIPHEKRNPVTLPCQCCVADDLAT